VGSGTGSAVLSGQPDEAGVYADGDEAGCGVGGVFVLYAWGRARVGVGGKPEDRGRVQGDAAEGLARFTNFEGHAIFFGDETSMAAAYALQSCARADARHRYVLEVTSAADAKRVVDSLGLRDVTLYQRTAEGEHLDGVVRKLMQSTGRDFEGSCDSDKTDKSGGRVAQWIFTGQAQSIQRVQKGLRELGVEVRRSKVRAYWSPGKTGMD